MHTWLLAEDWDSRHDLFIAVALLLDAGRVRSHTERLTLLGRSGTLICSMTWHTLG